MGELWSSRGRPNPTFFFYPPPINMSGIAVSDDCVQKFNELKLGHQHRYVTFKMNASNTEVVVEHVGGPNATYEDFKSQLPERDCRYAIFDYEFQVDGGQRNKITFILWAPDSAPIKAKMMYTSTKDSIKKKLVGIQVEVQATDAAEIPEDAVAERARRTSNRRLPSAVPPLLPSETRARTRSCTGSNLHIPILALASLLCR